MNRVSLKVTGAQGQGIISIGDICGKGLKRAGYCTYGYREYLSLIRGGHSSYQVDVSNEKIESSETRVNILVCLDHYGLQQDWQDVQAGGVLIHQTPMWNFPEEQQKWLDENNVQVAYIPGEEILKELKAPIILGNVLMTSIVWTLLGQDADVLKDLVREQYAHKGEDVINMNFACIDKGVEFITELEGVEPVEKMPPPDPKWKDYLYLTGSEAQGLGAIHGGCRMYLGYPMTPASPLLKFMADKQNETGMIIKQAEDEITASQMMSGAMYMGTRAMTATSGGGFDLMCETISMNGIIENPAVIGLAQRQGCSTGLPTWTGQGDLLLAIGGAHGEFPRLVLGLGDSQDAFELMPEAFNYAEEFQLPVIVLTDKHIAEGIFTQEPYKNESGEVRRGNLVTDQKELDALVSEDRYDPEVKDGISKRWLPGAKAATYCAQGDEHNASGAVDEGGENAKAQNDKRMRKMDALKAALPEPQFYGKENPEILLIGWGSTKSAALDVLRSDELKDMNMGYLHWQYLWPLRTETFEQLADKAKNIVLLEHNHQGQLGMLLKMMCGTDMHNRILKYDGRPFFYDELISHIQAVV